MHSPPPTLPDLVRAPTPSEDVEMISSLEESRLMEKGFKPFKVDGPVPCGTEVWAKLNDDGDIVFAHREYKFTPQMSLDPGESYETCGQEVAERLFEIEAELREEAEEEEEEE